MKTVEGSTLIERRLYTWISPRDWRWIRAIARTESGEDPYAHFGDRGKATGMFQMHNSFRADWQNEFSSGDTFIDDCHTLMNFWKHYTDEEGYSALEASLIFHYGLSGFSTAGFDDPDGYAAKINDNVTDEE